LHRPTKVSHHTPHSYATREMATATPVKAAGLGTDAGVSDNIVQAEVLYLTKEPKHEDEKPYEIMYNTEDTIPPTNMLNDCRPIVVHNFRPLQDTSNFEGFGFALAKIDCSMTAADFENESTVAELYYPAIERLLRETFPNAAQIRILEHGVRIPNLIDTS
jgi:hypothetical protein